MRTAPLALLLVAVAACGHRDIVSESWAQYYPQPYEETQATGIERREIIAFPGDPRKQQRIGYLEKFEIVLQGSRTRREFFYILDRRGVERLGFVTEIGEFFRYNRDGTRTAVGNYPIFDVGLKVFFGLSHDYIIRLDSIDPYRD